MVSTDVNNSVLEQDRCVQAQVDEGATFICFIHGCGHVADADYSEQVPLELYFPEYTGGSDLNKAAKYILWKFLQANRAQLRVYPQYVVLFLLIPLFADIG